MADLAFFEAASHHPDAALAELVEDGAGRVRRTIVEGVERFRA
jgi:hypothetical protein